MWQLRKGAVIFVVETGCVLERGKIPLWGGQGGSRRCNPFHGLEKMEKSLRGKCGEEGTFSRAADNVLIFFAPPQKKK